MVTFSLASGRMIKRMGLCLLLQLSKTTKIKKVNGEIMNSLNGLITEIVINLQN